MKNLLYFFTGITMMILSLNSFASDYDPFEDITPRPQEAYIREIYSAAFSIIQQKILLDPGDPAYKTAYFLNDELSDMGFDTLEIDIWDDNNLLNPNGIILSLPNDDINEMLSLPKPEDITITRSFPGDEGYVIDVLPQRAIIAGSNEAGLHYGVITLLQLLEYFKNDWIFSCRIVDAPDFEKRWYRYSTNFLVGENMQPTKEILRFSADHKLNGVALADGKFHFIDHMAQKYTDSLLSLKDYAAKHHMGIIPCIWFFGYSSSMLFHDPNLASGLPVYGQKFYINGKKAELVPGVDVTMPNPGFEEYDGNSFPGYRFIDQPGEISFADTEVKRSGNASIRLENFTASEHGHGRISYWTEVKPFTQYHVSGWVKTEDLYPVSGFNVSVLNKDMKYLNYWQPSVESTTDGWTKIDISFNSLDTDTVGVYWGVWGAQSGKMWWDDLLLEETAFVNLLRRDGCPLNVSHNILDIAYIEGVDYDTLIDPDMGNYKWSGNFDPYHEPPVFTPKEDGHIMDGDTLIISYYHAIVLNRGQITITMSDPKVYDICERSFHNVDDIFDADIYFMQHDEIRVMNWDAGDQRRNMTPAEILGDNTQKCYNIIKERKPAAEVWVWSDMYDNYHNARDNYYFVNGDLTNSIDHVPDGLKFVNWNGREGIVQNSLKFFEERDFHQISAPFYDNDEDQIRQWKLWTKYTQNFEGMLYTTWANDFSYIPHFGEYSWNNAPHIYHYPPQSFPGDELSLDVMIIGDKWDEYWQLDNVSVCYRTSPENRFTCKNFDLVPGKRETVKIQLPEKKEWIEYYISATDYQEWSNKVPFGVNRYYEIGDWSSSVDNNSNTFSFRISPNPAENILNFYITSGKASRMKMEIYNYLGEKLITFKDNEISPSESYQNAIDISELKSGVYFLSITSGTEKITKRFAVVK